MARQATPDLLGDPIPSEDPSLATMFGEMPPPQGSQALAKLSYAIHALAEARTLDDIKAIRNIAIAAQEYARAAKLGMDASNYAAEIRLRAERKAGEYLAELERGVNQHDSGARPTLDGHTEYRAVLDETDTTRQDANRWQQIAKLPVDVFDSALDHMKAIQKEISTSRFVQISRSFQQDDGAIHYSSDSPEWHTPPAIIERTERVLGAIDLDPCSNVGTANVPAARHYTWADDGLSQLWQGRVYMNPPYGREIGDWVDKLREAYETGNVSEAIALLPARTDTAWFHSLRVYPRCFVSGRLKFSEHGSAAPFPSMAVYLGRNLGRFVTEFGDIGDVFQIVEVR